MKNELVKVKKVVPLTIFEDEQVKERLDKLYTELKEDIEERYSQIKEFIFAGLAEEYANYTYDEIFSRFKLYWYKQILNEAVEITLTRVDAYNIKENILEMLTIQYLKKAIYGEPMTYAFTSVLREVRDSSFPLGLSKDIEIKRVEKQFSPKKAYI